MDAAQVHLAVNHFPLFLTLSGAILLVLAYSRRHPLLLRVGASFILAGALMALPAYFTGDGAEDVAESYGSVSEEYVEEHEEAAAFTLIIVEILGLAALIILFVTRKAGAFARTPALILLLMSLVALVVIARTAHLGGQIRHPEVRSGAAPTVAPEAEDDD